jgi:hypothetical protein
MQEKSREVHTLISCCKLHLSPHLQFPDFQARQSLSDRFTILTTLSPPFVTPCIWDELGARQQCNQPLSSDNVRRGYRGTPIHVSLVSWVILDNHGSQMFGEKVRSTRQLRYHYPHLAQAGLVFVLAVGAVSTIPPLQKPTDSSRLFLGWARGHGSEGIREYRWYI